MEITLSDGSIAFVDPDDYPLVSERAWHPQRDKNTIYARCSIGNKTVRMHRLIVGARAGETVDHRDGNGLNNRRGNLRYATSQQNNANKSSRSASGFKGVHKGDRGRRWKAIITINYERRHLGYFDTPEAAAQAYDAAAIAAFGEFALTNAGRLLDGREWSESPA